MPRLEKWMTRTINPFMPDMYLIGYVFDDEKNRLQKTVSHLLSSYYSCSEHDRKVKLQQEISDTINKR